MATPCSTIGRPRVTYIKTKIVFYGFFGGLDFLLYKINPETKHTLRYKLINNWSMKLPPPDTDFAKHTENKDPSFLSELQLDSGVFVNLIQNGIEPPHLSCDKNEDKKLHKAAKSIRNKMEEIIVDHASETNQEESGVHFLHDEEHFPSIEKGVSKSLSPAIKFKMVDHGLKPPKLYSSFKKLMSYENNLLILQPETYVESNATFLHNIEPSSVNNLLLVEPESKWLDKNPVKQLSNAVKSIKNKTCVELEVGIPQSLFPTINFQEPLMQTFYTLREDKGIFLRFMNGGNVMVSCDRSQIDAAVQEVKTEISNIISSHKAQTHNSEKNVKKQKNAKKKKDPKEKKEKTKFTL